MDEEKQFEQNEEQISENNMDANMEIKDTEASKNMIVIAVLAFIVVVLALVYLWGSRVGVNEMGVVDNVGKQQSVQDLQKVNDGTETDMKSNDVSTQSKSDEIVDIENDLSNIDAEINGLDEDLNKINEELNAVE